MSAMFVRAAPKSIHPAQEEKTHSFSLSTVRTTYELHPPKWISVKRSTVHEVLKQFFCAALYVIVLARTCGIHMGFTQSVQSRLHVFPSLETRVLMHLSSIALFIIQYNCTEY